MNHERRAELAHNRLSIGRGGRRIGRDARVPGLSGPNGVVKRQHGLFERNLGVRAVVIKIST